MRAVGYPLFLMAAVLLIRADILAAEAGDIELEKIIVTNRRAHSYLKEVTENTQVVGKEEIQGLPARDLGEALKYVPGVDIDPRKGFGRATFLSIQGSDSRQVRVMIDGIPLNSQSSGQVNPAIFPLENIERIEVIKGAASSTWGSALGGVINVITKDTGTTAIPKGSLTASFAEFRTRKEAAELSGKAGDLGYYLFSSYMDSGSRASKDDVLEEKAFAKASYDLNDAGKIIASFGCSTADVNSGIQPDGTWESQPYAAQYGKLGWEGRLEDTDLRFEFKHSRQKITTTTFPPEGDQTPPARADTKDALYELSLNSATRLRGDDLLVIGSDFDCDTLKSTYLTKAKSVRTAAPYLNYTLKLDPWVWNAGLRYDYNSEFGNQVSPSWGFTYRLKGLPETLLRASVSRAFNAPPLLWKYYEEDLSGLIMSPGIRPERAWVYELGAESQPLENLWFMLSLYRADVKDAIDVFEDDAGKRLMKNFQKFKRQGAEFRSKAGLCKVLEFCAGFSFNDIEDRATKKTVKGGGKPRYSLDAGLEYRNRGFRLSLLGNYDFWNEPGSSQPNDRKMLCGLKASNEFGRLALYFAVHNLTNSTYWRDYFYPLPARYFEGGFTLTW